MKPFYLILICGLISITSNGQKKVEIMNKGCGGVDLRLFNGTNFIKTADLIDTVFFFQGETIFFHYGGHNHNCPSISSVNATLNGDSIQVPSPNWRSGSFGVVNPGTYQLVWTQPGTFNYSITLVQRYNPPYSSSDEQPQSPHIYPNPSNGNINIGFEEETQATIYLFNLFGKLIYQKNSRASIHQINTSFFQKGNYVMKVVSNNNTFTERIIIQ